MGALTNKPMAFSTRNWEYNTQVTKDLTDFLSPRIRVDQCSGKISRILPTVDWISNKIRFLYLGLKNQRIVANLSTYKLKINFILAREKINFEKKILIFSNFKKLFESLNNRLLNKENKRINIILGTVYNSDLKLENYKQSKINYYLEFNRIQEITKFSSLKKFSKLLLVGVNPRMESPLLNLEIKEGQYLVSSFGNFSFSLPVNVVSNNLMSFRSYNENNNLAIFGLSTLDLLEYVKNKIVLVPLYYFNNIINYGHNINSNKKVNSTPNDINLYVSPQNIIQNNDSSLNIIIASHFEKILGNSNNNIRVPVQDYLESSIDFFNKDFSRENLNSLKPSFGLKDLFDAFFIFRFEKKSIINPFKFFGKNINNLLSKKRVYNKLIVNTIPNYLLRDPLSRANPLFIKS